MPQIEEGGQFRWEELYDGRLHVMTVKGCEGSSKIAAFDMDGTIITTKSGRVFPLDRDDWRLLYDSKTKAKLRSLHFDQGYKIVVVTNQAGIATGKVKLPDFKTKVENIFGKALANLPLQLFCSTAQDGIFRKPRPGIWEYLVARANGGIWKVDTDSSFYCGDAAGRLKKRSDGKKDFSCSDRLFALNIGLRFLTPETCFLEDTQRPEEPYALPGFDPRALLKVYEEVEPLPLGERLLRLLEPKGAPLATLDGQEVVLMVGIQGSGKSFFARNWFGRRCGYVVLSNDDLGGKADKTMTELKNVLAVGSMSCVLDNTHVDVNSRRKFVEVVRKFPGVGCRCFVMNTSFDQAKHNNVFRELVMPKGTRNHVKIGEPLMHSFKAKFQEPQLTEGFDQIVRVDFVPEFEYVQHRNLYFKYLLEK